MQGICSACILFCSQIAHFAALIVTWVYRYSGDGALCATKKEELLLASEDPLGGGLSYYDMGNKISEIFIAQCCVYCLHACCLGCLIQVAGFYIRQWKKR